MNQVGTYNNAELMIRRVYFTGTSQLALGQPLCYQEDSTSTTITTADPKNHFPFDVQIPDSTNVRVFAGIVAETSVGKTGPCYIDIIVPRENDILQVLVSQAASITAGDLLQLNVTVGTQTTVNGVAISVLGAFAAFTFASSTDFTAPALITALKLQPLVAALQSIASVDTSTSTRSLIWVQFR